MPLLFYSFRLKWQTTFDNPFQTAIAFATIDLSMEVIMNQDVQNIQSEEMSSVLSDRLNWDWRNPLIVLPMATVAVLLVGAMVMLMQLLNA